MSYNNGGETDWLPASRCKEFNPDRYDFFWNDDYTEFKAVKLLWWDDDSYIAYQAADDAMLVEGLECPESKEWMDMLGGVAMHLENGLPPWCPKPAELANLSFLETDHIPF